MPPTMPMNASMNAHECLHECHECLHECRECLHECPWMPPWLPRPLRPSKNKNPERKPSWIYEDWAPKAFEKESSRAQALVNSRAISFSDLQKMKFQNANPPEFTRITSLTLSKIELQSANPYEFTRIKSLRLSKNRAPERKPSWIQED